MAFLGNMAELREQLGIQDEEEIRHIHIYFK
jgi:hypothetical protein